MDTSEKYIQMCKAADEIQDFYNNIDNRIGKLVYYHQMPGKGMNWEVKEYTGLAGCCDYPSAHTEVIWLPTQELLQSLYTDHNITHLTYEFYRFCFAPQFARTGDKVKAMKYTFKFKSMEQLWLGFIMQEEWGKHWDGKRWIKM